MKPRRCWKEDGGATLRHMTSIDLRRLRLRPGEVRRDTVAAYLQLFHPCGQRSGPMPTVPAELEVSRASGAMVLNLRFQTRLSGPCMRCLGHAELAIDVSARELHDLDGEGEVEELRSDYVSNDRLDLGAWM